MSDSAFAVGEPIPGLSSWLLERKLGGGGFGEVWLAKHAWNPKERPRAVKFCLHPAVRHQLVTHEKNVVLRVMKYAGDHPNIVPLVECNLDGQTPWLMYEFVEGGTLAGLMDEWRALPLPKRLGRAVRTLHAIAGALARCHRLSPPLVHRDMKPANVLMADGKVPKITDFGIGSVVIPKGAETAGLTAMGARMPTMMTGTGTRLYAPPEQLLGSAPNPREDVYALGVMAFQMIAGDLGTGPGADAADELRALKVPSELAALVVRSVALNADRRPKDATEWELTLGALLQKSRTAGESADSVAEMKVVSPPPPTTRTPSRTAVPAPPKRSSASADERKRLRVTMWLCAAAVVGVLLCGGLAAFLAVGGKNDQAKKDDPPARKDAEPTKPEAAPTPKPPDRVETPTPKPKLEPEPKKEPPKSIPTPRVPWRPDAMPAVLALGQPVRYRNALAFPGVRTKFLSASDVVAALGDPFRYYWVPAPKPGDPNAAVQKIEAVLPKVTDKLPHFRLWN